jgi:hypothetical protein
LFDSRVFSNTKRQMLDRLSVKGPDRPVKRPDISLKSFTSLTLDTFVTSNSMNIFHCLQLPTDFLGTDPNTWETHAEFLAARHRLQGLKVVNDTAERGVALIQAFNKTLTHDEDQLQFLLQVVSEHRRLFPSTNKNVLAATSQTQQFYD